MDAPFDAVVIGGGLLGCATAWMIAREGGRVLLVERDQINQHASGRNAGSLHFQLEYRMIDRGIEAARQAAEAMPLHLEAARLWAALPQLCGEPVEVRQTGGLMIAEDARQVALLEQKTEIERSWGLDNQLIDRGEIDRIAPYLSDRVIAAAHCPLEGKADARTAAPALARAALRLGAEIRTGCAITGLSRQGGVWQVQLQGDTARTVSASAVVIAAGVWTTQLGQMMGAHLPTIPLALTMTVTMRIPKLVPHLVQHAGGKLSLKQALDGNILIGGGWPARLPLLPDGQPDLDTRPELLASSLAGNAAMAIRVLPELGKVPTLRSWVGTTTITPDQLPLVGPVPGYPGAFVATGGSAFTLGPCFAQVLADLISGRQASMDLTKFDAARYGRG
ncbi:MAG: FAD-dependent oxidoreductase [Rhodobacterales bacterium 65-51]|jgi:sarcosine oxidase subunit beta|uniref:NAD(P)/FAD-dependent oxidoreductase n=1 Tax=uncultured Gemmobacter sp. TaxID=1095917 RepID=UPI000960CB64|nr:FAD-dependent oxidoreductase [uncultured Gemmobacter sp.]OJY28370.1 MAG: FAD-dependent oxidoreductase [Rhodobacterales bacterium 65-51]